MRNARKLATALAAAALTAACYYGVPRYSQPAPDYEPGRVWYFDYHPHSVGYARGAFCYEAGPHSHDYAPYRTHIYLFDAGYYYWGGDPRGYDFRFPSFAYYGHHPHPFGGHCYIVGRHHHHRPPHRSHRYEARSGVYYFVGRFGPRYRGDRHRYDEHGRRHDHRSDGYREHERTHESKPAVAPETTEDPKPKKPRPGATQPDRPSGSRPDRSGRANTQDPHAGPGGTPKPIEVPDRAKPLKGSAANPSQPAESPEAERASGKDESPPDASVKPSTVRADDEKKKKRAGKEAGKKKNRKKKGRGPDAGGDEPER